MWQYTATDELYHHGIKGQKWGVRRYQNKDGSLTPTGKKRYAEELSVKKTAYKQARKEYNKSVNKASNRIISMYSPSKKHREASKERWSDAAEKANTLKKAKSEYTEAQNNYRKNASTSQKIYLGAKKASQILSMAGMTYLADQVLHEGANTAAAKSALNRIGNKVINKDD